MFKSKKLLTLGLSATMAAGALGVNVFADGWIQDMRRSDQVNVYPTTDPYRLVRNAEKVAKGAKKVWNAMVDANAKAYEANPYFNDTL